MQRKHHTQARVLALLLGCILSVHCAMEGEQEFDPDQGDTVRTYGLTLPDIEEEQNCLDVELSEERVTHDVSIHADYTPGETFRDKKYVEFSGPHFFFTPTRAFRISVTQTDNWGFRDLASCTLYARTQESSEAWEQISVRSTLHRTEQSYEVEIKAAQTYVVDPVSKSFAFIRQSTGDNDLGLHPTYWYNEIPFPDSLRQSERPLEFASFCYPTADWWSIEGDFNLDVVFSYENSDE